MFGWMPIARAIWVVLKGLSGTRIPQQGLQDAFAVVGEAARHPVQICAWKEARPDYIICRRRVGRSVFPGRTGCDKLASARSSQPEPRWAGHHIPNLTGLNPIQEGFVMSPTELATVALPPGPPAHPLTGNLRELGADRPAFLQHRARTCGDIVGSDVT